MDRIITIDRQYGSRGKQLAQIVGQRLGIPVFDSEIVKTAAEMSGISSEHFEKADEKRTSSFLFSLVTTHYGPSASMDVPNVINDDNLFLHTAAAIKKLACGACIFIGRCADDVLKDLNPLRLFVCADADSRTVTIAERLNIPEKDAANLVKKTDKTRASYYNFYTGREWGNPACYDLVLNTTMLPVQTAADMLVKLLA